MKTICQAKLFVQVSYKNFSRVPHGFKDFYAILGIPVEATRAEIEEAYVHKVKFCQYKDSMVGNSKEGLHSDDLQTAYDTLTDPTFR